MTRKQKNVRRYDRLKDLAQCEELKKWVAENGEHVALPICCPTARPWLTTWAELQTALSEAWVAI